MGIIYPDNQNRANRVEQLATFIAQIQKEVSNSLDRVGEQTGHQTDAVNAIFKLMKISSPDDLAAAIAKLLTPEQQAAYDAMVQHIRDEDATTSKILDATTLVSFIAGSLALGAAPVARILSTGALAAGCDLFSRGFRLMIAGDEAGIRMMGAAFRTFRALQVGAEVSQEASQIVRIVRTAGTVLSVLGLVLDGVVLIYEAIEGAKQKAALDQGIQELFSRRFMCQRVEDQTFVTEGYVAQVSAYLVTYQTMESAGASDDLIKSVMDKLLASVMGSLNADLLLITDDKVWAECASLDSAGHAWTDDDPSRDWVMTWIGQQPPLVPDGEKQSQLVRLHQAVDRAGGLV